MKLFLFITLALYVSAQLSVPGGYSVVDPDEVDNNAVIQNALTWGARHVVEQGIHEGNLDDADYDVTGIYNVWVQVVNGRNYKFDVELNNELGTVVRASYVVWIPSGSEEPQKISDVSYAVEGPGEVDEGELGEFDFLPEEVYFSEEEGGFYDGEDALAGGWQPADVNDPEVKAALDWGLKQVIPQARTSGEIPDQKYQQDQLISAEEQVVAGMNYRFVIDLAGDGGAVVRVQLEVYQLLDGTMNLDSYKVLSVA